MMKKILVTGADGFIGSHLVEELLLQGYSVKAFVYYNSFNSWGWLDALPKDILSRIEIFPGDIRDSSAVFEAAKDCDAIFHLAALIAIPYSYYAPESYVQTNVTGTLNVLQASRRYDIRRVLVTSTSEVYGTAQQIPITESHPRQGQSPYSATKIAADALSDSFFRSFDLPVTIVRPFNTYGPRQSARAVIPTIITQLLEGYTDIKLGLTYPTRDLVYVKDTAKGFISILNSEELIGQDVNIATQSEISVLDLAEMIISQINSSARIVSDSERLRPEKSEVYRLLGSNEKIRKYTSWQPTYSIEEGIRETIKWFSVKENVKAYKTDIYNK
jgi:NAD dependent epimerase/dehydratase